ncbi:MAG: putative Peptidase [Bacteriovoracaceae bacterium]|nr:putative Peptidase [Bacteriovoracaceae bacterium]
MENHLRIHIDELCKERRNPQSAGYFKAQEYLKSALNSLGLNPLEHHFHVWGLGKCTNIYAESKPGSLKPTILIGAHYETLHCSGPGADDNASAVAVALEIARELFVKGQDFTICFFDMEENYRFTGLRGSKAFKRFYSRPIEKVLIMDLVGGSLAPHFDEIYLQFGDSLPKLAHPELDFLHLPMLVVEPMGSIGARSDYDVFRKAGLPFTFISSGTPWYYHTAFDTPKILNFKKMAGLTRTLSDALSNRSESKTKNDGSLDSFQKFLRTLRKTKVLEFELIEKLLNQNRLPSRIEMVKLYKHILPTIRKHGADLWKMRSRNI